MLCLLLGCSPQVPDQSDLLLVPKVYGTIAFTLRLPAAWALGKNGSKIVSVHRISTTPLEPLVLKLKDDAELTFFMTHYNTGEMDSKGDAMRYAVNAFSHRYALMSSWVITSTGRAGSMRLIPLKGARPPQTLVVGAMGIGANVLFHFEYNKIGSGLTTRELSNLKAIMLSATRADLNRHN